MRSKQLTYAVVTQHMALSNANRAKVVESIHVPGLINPGWRTPVLARDDMVFRMGISCIGRCSLKCHSKHG